MVKYETRSIRNSLIIQWEFLWPHTCWVSMVSVAADYFLVCVTETGKILPRKDTGLSAKLQRRVTKLIKQGRNMLTMK